MAEEVPAPCVASSRALLMLSVSMRQGTDDLWPSEKVAASVARAWGAC